MKKTKMMRSIRLLTHIIKLLVCVGANCIKLGPPRTCNFWQDLAHTLGLCYQDFTHSALAVNTNNCRFVVLRLLPECFPHLRRLFRTDKKQILAKYPKGIQWVESRVQQLHVNS